jgi:predicted nucleic acid-binding protein
MTDCISFIIMKEQGNESALSFDKHFTQAGFKVLP